MQTTACSQCNYVLDAFDAQCPRCHGRGLPQPAPVVAQVQVAPRQRTVRGIAVVFLLLLMTGAGAWQVHRHILWSQGTVLGTYWVPSLQDWHQAIEEKPAKRYQGVSKGGKPYDFTMPATKQITFTRQVDGDTLKLNFEAMFWPHPVHTQALFGGTAAATLIRYLCAQSRHKTFSILERGPIRYRNQPAFIVHTVGQAPRGEDLQDDKTLDFADGTISYCIMGTVQGQSISPLAQAQMNQAWALLETEMQHI